MKSVFIFAPNTLNKNDIGFLEGFTREINDNLVFYITNDKLILTSDNTVGYCSSQTPYNIFTREDSEWIHINNTTHEIQINNLDNYEYEAGYTIILYDINAFAECDITTFRLQEHGEHFDELCSTLHKINYNTVKPRFMIAYIILMFLIETILEVFRRGKRFFQHSSVLIHLENSINMLRWCINSVQNSERIPIKIWNSVMSKMVDFIFGFIVLYLFFEYERDIIKFLDITVNEIIHGLKNLLSFLMGSPIGLKLNYAFNRTLGTFFFYHIFLWKTFMEFIKPYIYSVHYILLIPAGFGLSFQAAILEDLIKICTMHMYCIYIYAARLYGLQINGLVALWRLFIGRKFNPLRNRVDSHEYNHNQLFIGILAFTIFLFLLPTTLLYYIVFTVFRLLLKILDFFLMYLRVLVLHLPVYSFLLWVIDSPLVAAAVVVTVESKIGDLPAVLRATLKSLPLVTCVKSTIPYSSFDKPKIKWEKLNNIFTGKLL